MPTDDSTPAQNGDAPPTLTEAAAPDGASAPSARDRFGALAAEWTPAADRRPEPAAIDSPLPRLSAAAAGDAPAAAGDLLSRVRRFHAGDPGAADTLDAPPEEMLPALLQPFRDPTRVRHEYPLVLLPPDHDAGDVPATPLSDLLRQACDAIGPGPDDARILKDNLERLEHHIRQPLVEATGILPDAADLISKAAQSMEEALALRGESGRRLHEDLQRLLAAISPNASLLLLGAHAPAQLFLHAAHRRAAARRQALRADATRLGEQLRDLLRLDDVKRAGTEHPESLAAAVGAAGGRHLDPDALARLLGRARGSAAMDPVRRARLERALRELESFSPGDAPLVLFIHSDDLPVEGTPPVIDRRRTDSEQVCRTAIDVFDETAAAYGDLFVAMRIARLELEAAYDPARHDALQEAFDWRAFSRDELLNLPPILAVASATHVSGAGMPELSRLLLSARPVNLLVTVDPAMNPGDPRDHDPAAGFRFELGYLGMSHREAMVHQSSAARPRHLLDGFARSLDATCASLHVVASERGPTRDGAGVWTWLHEGAALEGRAHPLFHYNPELGETWARRLDFSGNPQPESDWPVYDMPFRNENGDEESRPIAFTYADFALLEPEYRDHFRVLPPDLDSEALVTVDVFLAANDDVSLGQVPYVWAVDTDDQLHRLAITRSLAFACRDRLAYWHTLQELAGVRNEYVREAIARERQRLETEYAAERRQAAEAHEAEMETVRVASARDAMRSLAQALLRRDAGAIAAAAAEAVPFAAPTPPAPAPPAEVESTPGPTAASPEAAGEKQAEAAAELEEAEEPEEPWIEAALCTSCNDCLEINPRLFIYNANKQAVIGDPRAGTYEELVRAAEKCPARCIHPGRPLDPNEPNLETLIERARPFQ